MKTLIHYFKKSNIETNYLTKLDKDKFNIIKIILTNDPEISFYYGMHCQYKIC